MFPKSLGAWLTVPLLAWAGFGAAGSDTRLVDAVKNADRPTVMALMQKHVDVNTSAADGMTALHWAVQRDDAETADMLIRAGANVNAATRLGVRPLLLASRNGNAALIDKLLKAGADVSAASPGGETPLMEAARNGKVDALKTLLLNGADPNAKEGWKGQSAMMWAAAEGHAAAVKALVEAGADLRLRSKGGFTPLLFAIRNGHIETVRLLLASGGNPNETVGGAPTSALSMAVINGYYELAALLLDRGADPNVPDPRGSILHAVAFMRNPGTGPNGGAPPAQTGNLDSLGLAKALLAHGASPNARIAWREKELGRESGTTRVPADIPLGRNFLSFVGATPFYLAAKGGDVELMHLLAAGGADPRMPTVQGVTPLMAAAGLGYWDGESPGPLTGVPESQAVEAVKLTLAFGNDVNAVAEFGGPALEGDGGTLLRRHALNLLEYDAPHEVPLDVTPPKDSLGDMRWSGSTALIGAAARGSNAIVQLLVDRGAKLEAKNKLGWTALMCAEGVFVSNTEKDWPDTVALLRTLMQGRGLNPDLNNQKSLGLSTSREVSQN